MPAPSVHVPALEQLPRRQRRTLAMGLLAQTRGDYAEAVRCYMAASRRDPADFLSLYFAALTSFQLKDKQRAVRLMYASLNRQPAHPEAWYNLGKFYQDLAQPHRALECYVAALEHRADFGQALVNAGNVAWELGDEALAESCYRKALVCERGTAEATYNLSFLLHLKGDWPRAFEAQEARWQCPGYWVEYKKPFMDDLPTWDGGEVPDGALLLHGEQGHGDILQMLRYVPQVIARIGGPGRLVIGVLDGLVRLVQASFPAVRVVGTEMGIEGCTVQLPSVSLPYVLGTSWENLPPKPPYLLQSEQPPPRPAGATFRIGLCWAGSPTHPRDHARSMPFAALAPLLSSEVEWVNLQYGGPVEAWREAGVQQPVAMLDQLRGDYLDTARLLQTCDLLITVDTSVAHLAGALGVECWMLVARFPDVRWMLARSDTPWYPSLQIFRQTTAGDWSEVVRIVQQLLALKVQFRSRLPPEP